MSFFMLIAAVIFIIAIVSAGGLYFYKRVLAAQNETKRADIEEAIKNFDDDLTKQLTLLRTRLDVANQLLSNHTAFTAFLNILQQNTVQTIRYTELRYAVAQDKTLITMKGEASSYVAIAYQSDVLSANDSLKSVVVSDLALNEGGTISFNVKSEIDPKAISYESTIVPPSNEPSSATGLDIDPGTDLDTEPVGPDVGGGSGNI